MTGTGLLVSVRDVAEAETALRGGATLIDVKEPRFGSLGRAAACRWREVAARVAGRVPVSVACGELLEGGPPPACADLASIHYVKCGLAGCGRVPDWPARWIHWLQRLPAGTNPVAVAYADWARAAAPPPAEVLQWAARAGCRAMLWDTYLKDGTWLLDHVSHTALEQSIGAARAAGLLVVLAGSLTLHRVGQLLCYAPDYLAVRGAACGGGRAGVVCQPLVEQLAAAVAGAVQSTCRSGPGC